MTITYSRRFKKNAQKLPHKIQRALTARIRVFSKNPHDIQLHNHALSGPLRNYRSINITGDYRLIYEEYDKSTVRLIDIDTHSNLYGA